MKSKIILIVGIGLLLGWWVSGWEPNDEHAQRDDGELPDFPNEAPIYGLREGQVVALRFQQPSFVRDADLADLARLPQLEVLDLRGTSVTDAGLPYLWWLKRLREVYLDGSQVSARGVSQLSGELPGCNIWWRGRNWNDGNMPRAVEIRASI